MQLFALVVIFVEVLTAGTLVISNPNSGFAKPVKNAVGKVLGISYLAQDTTEQPHTEQPSSSSDQPAPAPDQNSNNQPAAQPQQQPQTNQQQVQTQPNQTQESQVQQDQSAPQDAAQNPNPTPDTANSSSQTVQTTNNAQQAQTNIQNSTSDQLKTDEQSLLNQTPTETPAPQVLQNNEPAKSQTTTSEPSASETPQEKPTPIPTPPQDLPQVDELNAPSQQALLNTDDVISTPQKVDESSQNEAKQEDKTLENLSPNQQTQKLLEFSKSKILDIDRNLKEDDFSTTSFLAQRLDNQLSQVSDALSKTTGTQNTNLRKQVLDFCKQAGLAMQSQETFVPEDMEQDIQIARGQCMMLEQ